MFRRPMLINGLRHYDVGGNVTQTPATQPGSAYPTGSNPAGQGFSEVTKGVSKFEQPSNQAVQQISNDVGGTVQGMANAFTPQNHYVADLAPITHQDYNPLVNTGFNSTANNLNAQQQLAQMYMSQAQGQGPNPAQSMLAQQTGNNIAAQASLMAGQRGTGANAGMLARQVGQQGAAIQQQAVGQSATLQAQQQLAAQQGAAQLYGQIGQQSGNLLGQGISGQNTQNANDIQNYSMAQGINSQIAQNNANAVGKTTSGLMNGASSIAGLVGLAHGGQVGYSDGGGVAQVTVPNLTSSGSSGIDVPNMNDLMKKLKPGGGGGGEAGDASGAGSGAASGAFAGSAGLAHGGMSHPAHEPQSHVARFLKGMSTDPGYCSGGTLMAANGMNKVPGKAQVAGDSSKNDTVKAMLSPGEIVIPRSHATDPGKAAAFARAVVMRNRKGKGKK